MKGMVFALKILLTLALLYVGVTGVGSGVSTFLNRRRILALIEERRTEGHPLKHPFVGSGIVAVAGLSFVLASILLWRLPIVAAVLVACPFAAYVAGRLSGRIKVISRLSTGPN